MQRIKQLILEAHRRSLWQVLLIYLGVAWIVLQVVNELTEAVGLPDWAPGFALMLLLVGLPVVVATTFVQERPDSEQDAERHAAKDPVSTSWSTSTDPTPTRLFTWRNTLLGALAAAALWGVAAAVWLFVVSESASEPPTTQVETDTTIVAVFPFRVQGADASLGYLGAGTMELLSTLLNGEGGYRAVNPSVVLSRLANGGHEPESLSQQEATHIARAIGAGRLILGGLVGNSRNLVFNASLLDSSTGEQVAQATAEGPPDSLQSALDRLSVNLMAHGRGDDPELLADVTSRSPAALRAFLDGRSAYRRGDYGGAADRFADALRKDSTFALAALGLRMAANWQGAADPEFVRLAERVAWRQAARLSRRDRSLFFAVVGPGYPGTTPLADHVAAAQAAVDAAPDSPEAWYELGDLYLHEGTALGVPEWRTEAEKAFARSLQLDPGFAAAHEHLIDVLSMKGNVSELVPVARAYQERHGGAENAGFYRWRVAAALGDEERIAAFWAQPDHSPQSLWRVIGWSLIEGTRIKSSDRAAEALLDRVATPGERATDRSLLLRWSLNRGRASDFGRLIRAGRAENPRSTETDAQAIIAALYSDGDPELATESVKRLTSLVTDPPPAGLSPLDPEWERGVCVLGLWHAEMGNRQQIEATLGRLTPPNGGGQGRNDDEATGEPAPSECTIVLRALLHAGDPSGPGAASLAALEALSRTSGEGTSWLTTAHIDLFVLSRLHEQAGRPSAGLAATQRRYFGWSQGIAYLSALLLTEARLAEAAGEPETAIRALRHYVTLREGGDSRTAEDLANARRDLARLESSLP